MRRGRPTFRRSTSKCWTGVLILTLVLGAVSCAEQGAEEQVPERESVVKAENAEFDKTLEAGGWTVALVDQPERAKQVGSGAADWMTNEGSGFGGLSGIREADGVWLILVLEIVNVTGDLAFIPKSLLTVTDAEGGRYEPATVREAAGPLINADERWESLEENQLVQWVFKTEVPREGPLVFDVPQDATGLKLVMEGTEETIDLGF